MRSVGMGGCTWLQTSVTPVSWSTGTNPVLFLSVCKQRYSIFDFFFFLKQKHSSGIDSISHNCGEVGKTSSPSTFFQPAKFTRSVFFQMVAKSVGRSQPSDNLCCVSHISGKDEIISQEEFISGCGKSGRRSRQVVRPNPRVLQARRGGGLGASGLAQEASAFAFTGLQRGDLFLWFILFCRFVEKGQVNVPCYAILCWWKESAHDVIWNGKAITRQWQKMPVIFSWSYFRIIYCQLQYFARSKYFVEYI